LAFQKVGVGSFEKEKNRKIIEIRRSNKGREVEVLPSGKEN
jgi:hypothetical protein